MRSKINIGNTKNPLIACRNSALFVPPSILDFHSYRRIKTVLLKRSWTPRPSSSYVIAVTTRQRRTVRMSACLGVIGPLSLNRTIRIPTMRWPADAPCNAESEHAKFPIGISAPDATREGGHDCIRHQPIQDKGYESTPQTHSRHGAKPNGQVRRGNS
jgi:hypothetical protein